MVLVRLATTPAARAVTMLRTIAEIGTRCPCHGSGCPHPSHRRSAHVVQDTDYAFEMATSTIRFGPGATAEVGHDFAYMGAKNVLLVTDQNLKQNIAVTRAMQSLETAGVKFTVFDRVRVEPTDASFKEAISVAKAGQFDAYLAVGGGSVMDTAKAANLYACFPDADFLDFVNAPIGKGLPVPGPVKPLIAVPTTSGTGSETTGVAIFDYEPLKAKTGIANRVLKPTLGIVDPQNMLSMPAAVAAASGFDVLCHALESFTALPYNQRSPRPTLPKLRPAYQGSNPISDVWCQQAMAILAKYFVRSVKNPNDYEAREAMALAATYAGVGFGNAGVHLPHGMSYAISGNNKTYKHPGYNVNHKIVPHGVSVVMSAPAVFRFTAPACPDRHMTAARLLGANVTGKSDAMAGDILAETVLKYMEALDVPNGLTALGYQSKDIPALVESTLPQHRVTKLSPNPTGAAELQRIFEAGMTVY